MGDRLNHRDLWSLETWSADQMHALLDDASTLKRQARMAKGWHPLRGTKIALLSAAHWALPAVAFTSAAIGLGAQVAFIDADNAWTGGRGLREGASMLGRLYDAVECLDLPLEVVEEICEYVGKPVFNGLARADHPTRILADLLTMRENATKPLTDVKLCFCGNARTPAAAPWLYSAALLGFALHVVGPRATWPLPNRVRRVQALAHEYGRVLRLTRSTRSSPIDTPINTDFLYDERTARYTDDRGQLAIPLAGHAGVASLGEVQTTNQQFILQALLVGSIT